MPQIYLTEKEMSALAYFQDVTQSAYETLGDEDLDEDLQKEYNQHCNSFYSVHNKYFTAKKKAADKALVKRVLKDIKTNK